MTRHPMSSADIALFHQKSTTFVVSNNKDINCILIKFLILLTIFESLKVVLINIVAILMMSAKLATLGLLKLKIF